MRTHVQGCSSQRILLSGVVRFTLQAEGSHNDSGLSCSALQVASFGQREPTSTKTLLHRLWQEQKERESESADVVERRAAEYLQRLRLEKSYIGQSIVTGIWLDSFQEYVLDLGNAGGGMPRIYLLHGGSWDRICDSQEILGYRYSMEHWIRRFLLHYTSALTENIEEADYVYLPHCATAVFAMLAREEPATQQNIIHEKRSGSSSVRRSANVTLQFQAHEETNLPPNVVRRTDETYLMHLVQTWSDSTAFQVCRRRANCKFLIASIHGRHVWRQFSNVFADEAVIITHSGRSHWIAEREANFFLRRPVLKAEHICQATCPEHCVLDPPAVLPHDVILPWPVHVRWTQRASNFSGRDVLVFFSGTGNSCSRRKLVQSHRKMFERELAQATEDGARSSGHSVRGHQLIFPFEFKLKQEIWSEIAFRSQICIVIDGDTPNTPRLGEVITHGCVPLIISDRLQPPFHDYIDWQKMAFFLRESSIGELPSILQELTTPSGRRLVKARHRFLAQAAYFLDYNEVGLQTMILYALIRASANSQASTAKDFSQFPK